MKTCTGCCKEKELLDFYRDGSRNDGFNYKCKDCCKTKASSRKNSKLHPSRGRILEEKDIYYLAGIIEGEGCFSVFSGKRGGGRRLRVEMTDYDIIFRLQQISEMGKITGPYNRIGNHGQEWKPIWHWSVNKKTDLARLLLAIYPVMGERRQKELARLVETLGRAK